MKKKHVEPNYLPDGSLVFQTLQNEKIISSLRLSPEEIEEKLDSTLKELKINKNLKKEIVEEMKRRKEGKKRDNSGSLSEKIKTQCFENAKNTPECSNRTRRMFLLSLSCFALNKTKEKTEPIIMAWNDQLENPKPEYKIKTEFDNTWKNIETKGIRTFPCKAWRTDGFCGYTEQNKHNCPVVKAWLERKKETPYSKIEKIFEKETFTKFDVDEILKLSTRLSDALILDEIYRKIKIKMGYSVKTLRQRRWQLIQEEKPEEQKIKEIPEDMLEILQDCKLFETITETELDKKIVGEIENRKAIFLVACGVFVENHNTASFNLAINSESGAGKDFVTNNTLAFFPEDILQKRGRISETVFTYWHQNDPGWTWNGKICYLSDVSNKILNCEVFKVMVSDGASATIVIDHKAVDITIPGKPVMFVSFASSLPNNEILRRFPMMSLNETRNQTKEIMKRQAKYAMEGISIEYDQKTKKALTFLSRVRVIIPFAPLLPDSFPQDHIIMRTHFYRFLDYIKASAAFHQFQRERDETGAIIAEPKDYDLAIVALKQTTQNALMIPLTKKQQKLIDNIRENFEDEYFSAPQLIAKCSFLSQQSIYDYLDKLQENFFETDRKDIEGSRKPVKVYKIRKTVNVNIPSFEEICKTFGIVRYNRIDIIDIIDRIDTNNSNKSINYTQNRTVKNQFLNKIPEKGEITYAEWENSLLEEGKSSADVWEAFERLKKEKAIFEPRPGTIVRL